MLWTALLLQVVLLKFWSTNVNHGVDPIGARQYATVPWSSYKLSSLMDQDPVWVLADRFLRARYLQTSLVWISVPVLISFLSKDMMEESWILTLSRWWVAAVVTVTFSAEKSENILFLCFWTQGLCVIYDLLCLAILSTDHGLVRYFLLQQPR